MDILDSAMIELFEDRKGVTSPEPEFPLSSLFINAITLSKSQNIGAYHVLKAEVKAWHYFCISGHGGVASECPCVLFCEHWLSFGAFSCYLHVNLKSGVTGRGECWVLFSVLPTVVNSDGRRTVGASRL